MVKSIVAIIIIIATVYCGKYGFVIAKSRQLNKRNNDYGSPSLFKPFHSDDTVFRFQNFKNHNNYNESKFHNVYGDKPIILQETHHHHHIPYQHKNHRDNHAHHYHSIPSSDDSRYQEKQQEIFDQNYYHTNQYDEGNTEYGQNKAEDVQEKKEQEHVIEYEDINEDHDDHDGNKDEENEKGYSIGSGLRSIAQGSANQAHSAVVNQHAAAKQAAYLAKNGLAQTALQAAATAQAALTGKEVLLSGLKQQVVDARRALEAEIAQLNLAKKSAKSAQLAAIESQNHVASLTATLNSAQSSAKNIEQTAHKAASELASQTSMVGKAKSKLDSLEKQLKAAHKDYVVTKEATIKAAVAAKQAQVNADEAGAHATIELVNAANSKSADITVANIEYDDDSKINGESDKSTEDGEISVAADHYQK